MAAGTQLSQAERDTRGLNVPVAVSLRQDQRQWIEAEAIRQRHGNRSRIVQDAIDFYQTHRDQQALSAANVVNN